MLQIKMNKRQLCWRKCCSFTMDIVKYLMFVSTCSTQKEQFQTCRIYVEVYAKTHNRDSFKILTLGCEKAITYLTDCIRTPSRWPQLSPGKVSFIGKMCSSECPCKMSDLTSIHFCQVQFNKYSFCTSMPFAHSQSATFNVILYQEIFFLHSLQLENVCSLNFGKSCVVVVLEKKDSFK